MTDDFTDWRKSSRSVGGGACVEVADGILVRDSTDPDGPRLAFGTSAWQRFTGRLKADDRT